METKSGKTKVKIELTPEQVEQVRQATGKEITAVELTAEELEERVAPGVLDGLPAPGFQHGG